MFAQSSLNVTFFYIRPSPRQPMSLIPSLLRFRWSVTSSQYKETIIVISHSPAILVSNKIDFNVKWLGELIRVGIENAINTCKVQQKRWKAMTTDNEDSVLTTQEACHYLRISRPTYLKYLYGGRIKGAKAGKGWKVLKSELDRFLKGENGQSHAA